MSTNSDLLCNKLKSLRNYGRDREDGSLNQYAGSNKRVDEMLRSYHANCKISIVLSSKDSSSFLDTKIIFLIYYL